jgi:hypothetical protein
MIGISNGPACAPWARAVPSGRRALATILIVVASALACGGDGPYAPITGEPDLNTATVTDPIGDTFSLIAPLWDATRLTISRDATGIVIVLDLSVNAVSPVSGDDGALIAFVDLDLDQDPTTGLKPVSDDHRPDGGSSGTRSDARVNLSVYGADSTVEVTGPHGLAGRVKPVFEGRHVTVRVPRAMLDNDDGFLNATALVGNSTTPTDIIPEVGHLTLGPPAQLSRIMRPRALPR